MPQGRSAMIFRILAVLFLVSLIDGCANDKQYENYKMVSPADLTLSQLNHPHGWAQTECFICHNPDNIHKVDRLHDPSFSSAQSTVDQFGITRCYLCHGNNGVSP
jgi:hypothetical protein